MKYYVFTIEQTIAEGGYSEYAGTKKFNDEQSALVHFYKRGSEVSNALGTTHVYMDIKIVNSLGGIIKKDRIGKYVEEDSSNVEPDENTLV